MWYNKYNYTDSVAFNDLIPANDGGYIAVGSVVRAEYETGDLDAMLMAKIDDQGKEVWSEQFKERIAAGPPFPLRLRGMGGMSLAVEKVSTMTKTT